MSRISQNAISQAMSRFDFADGDISTELKRGSYKYLMTVCHISESLVTNDKVRDANIHCLDGNPRDAIVTYLHRMNMLGVANTDIAAIVSGHEHGKNNKKCHYQMFVVLKETLPLNKKHLFIDCTDYAFISQKAKKPANCYKYCTKDGEFDVWGDKEAFVFKQSADEAKMKWRTLYDIDNNEAMKDYLVENMPFQSAIYGARIVQNVRFFKPALHVPFVYKWPTYLNRFMQDVESDLGQAMSLIKEWFDEFCLKVNRPTRLRGLLLFTPDREMGKTTMMKAIGGDYLMNDDGSLVLNEHGEAVPITKDNMGVSRIIYNRTKVNAEPFITVDSPSLVFWDDLALDHRNFDPVLLESIKALCAGETTVIKSNYKDPIFVNNSVPFVMAMNNKQLWDVITMPEDDPNWTRLTNEQWEIRKMFEQSFYLVRLPAKVLINEAKAVSTTRKVFR